MTIAATPRLVLRNWTEAPTDLARLYDMYSRPEVARFLGTSANLPLTDPAQVLDRLAWWRERHADHGDRYGTWAIEVRDSGLAVGTALLKPLPGRDESQLTDDIEVGWHLHPDSWGHGYATEAARALVDRELATGTPVVHAVTHPENTASMAVARRLGMTHIGRRTDWYGGEELETFVLRRPA
ncbi:GNAT family N-acetyltransferase [Micromonospora fluostatini]|uniref:GNAT family N-acetyltransferase n=1 Tax=Micromonospora sp. JCM 30529 TaxID=3421643 RepID=UPI003D1726DB